MQDGSGKGQRWSVLFLQLLHEETGIQGRLDRLRKALVGPRSRVGTYNQRSTAARSSIPEIFLDSLFSNLGISCKTASCRPLLVIAMKEGKSRWSSARRKAGPSRTRRPGRLRIGHSAQVWQQKAHIHHPKTQFLASPHFLPNRRGSLSRLLIEPKRPAKPRQYVAPSTPLF